MLVDKPILFVVALMLSWLLAVAGCERKKAPRYSGRAGAGEGNQMNTGQLPDRRGLDWVKTVLPPVYGGRLDREHVFLVSDDHMAEAIGDLAERGHLKLGKSHATELTGLAPTSVENMDAFLVRSIASGEYRRPEVRHDPLRGLVQVQLIADRISHDFEQLRKAPIVVFLPKDTEVRAISVMIAEIAHKR